MKKQYEKPVIRDLSGLPISGSVQSCISGKFVGICSGTGKDTGDCGTGLTAAVCATTGNSATGGSLDCTNGYYAAGDCMNGDTANPA